MEFEDLLYLVGDLPLFTSTLLQAGDVDRANIQKQLSRWTTADKINQLRRGLYTLAKPYRQKDPHPFLIANHLISPSYVSMQSALAYYDLIPEAVPQVLSVTSKFRSQVIETPLGSYRFHHVNRHFFTGFQLVQVIGDQSVFLARPEKALLDLIYLTKQGYSRAYLESLRLQNLDELDFDWMQEAVDYFGSSKLIKAVDNLQDITADISLRRL